MNNNSIWHRRDNKDSSPRSSKEEYFKLLFDNNISQEQLNSLSLNLKCGAECECKNSHIYCKIENALKEAHEIRRFEISLFWKRAQFFWVFIGVIFAAYGAVIFPALNLNPLCNISTHKYILLTGLNYIGVIVTYMWYEVIKSSKYWQENWEFHIDMLEEHVTGHIHKVMHRSDRKIISVSKLCSYLAILCFWIFCIIQILCTFLLYKNNLFLVEIIFTYITSVLFTILFIYNSAQSTSVK